jgi:uncharacterized protein (DUF924 family)
MTPGTILDFWFGEIRPAQWFKPDAALDAEITRRFGAVYEELSTGVAEAWRFGAREILAAVVVLDQFPRNMFRGTPKAFATDAAALVLAERSIERGADRLLTQIERQFLYMPFQHSEELAVQERSIALFEALGDASVLDFARRHHAIVKRFGRFPHRNAVLGRASTGEEIAFLKQPGSSF